MTMAEKVKEWLAAARHDTTYQIAYSAAYEWAGKRAKDYSKDPETFLNKMVTAINSEIKRTELLGAAATKSYKDGYVMALSRIRLELLKSFLAGAGADDEV